MAQRICLSWKADGRDENGENEESDVEAGSHGVFSGGESLRTTSASCRMIIHIDEHLTKSVLIKCDLLPLWQVIWPETG